VWDPTLPPVPEPAPTPLRWRVFFQKLTDRERAAAALMAAWPTLTISRLDVEDEDWAARSQRSLTAVRAGRFIVAPPWDLPRSPAAPGQPRPPRDPIVIVIEPSMGFGTGHHATTRLCLRLLSGTSARDRDVLDIGTGSGVLAMAASLDGARRVVALDVDGDAIGSARHSAALNTLPCPIDFRIGDFRQRGAVEAADLVFANLTGGMLVSAAAELAAAVRAGGTLIVSGFDAAEAEGVRTALAGLHEDARIEEENWGAMQLKSGSAPTIRRQA
jgi:ribosomal protein L11 methyltransferase